MRAGFDVPIKDGVVTDTTRIDALQETMMTILQAPAVLIVMAHQGRPKDAPDPAFSQKPLVPVLERLLKTTVHFSPDCVGDVAKKTVASAKPGDVVLLENLRFHPEEKKNDAAFAKELASLGDVYVAEAFSNAHRNHASMVEVAKLLPSYMGFALEREVVHLNKIIHETAHPLTLIIGGAKLETKIPIISNFLTIGDDILIGGAVANTFIAARGFDVGTSKYDEGSIDIAQNLMLESEKDGRAVIHVPRDAVVATEAVEGAEKIDIPLEDVGGDMAIFDIGTVSVKRFCEVIAASKMIIWNGPVGLFEINRFSHASKRIAEAMAAATKNGAMTVVGGGDTLDFHERYGYDLSVYTFVSMGGGAMLEFLAGKELPSIVVLEEKNPKTS